MKRLSQRFPILAGQKDRATYRAACERFDLVYFGTVSQYSDEHAMVRGFTLSSSHVDRHYCVGTIAGRDVILLERTDTISFPGKPSQRYSWTLLQIDLRTSAAPHIVLNPTQYDQIVYDSLFSRFLRMRQLDMGYFKGHDEKFTSQFRVYGALQRLEQIMRILVPGTTSVLGHHFAQFDYECYHDRLIVYYPTKSPSLKSIEHQIKAGLWLAGEIDSSTPPPQAATQIS